MLRVGPGPDPGPQGPGPTPGQSMCTAWLGSNLAWPRPQLLNGKIN